VRKQVRRTDAGLAVYEHSTVLVNLCFDERDGGDEMTQDISVFFVVK
jgi:hypothetical protein